MYINKQSNIQKKDLVSTKTASGNPVVISDCAGGKARSLITEINAIQDLHGQSAPYVGGAGKNKLPMTVTSIKAANTLGTWSDNAYTLNGVTFTILTDSADNVTGIKANGTASAATYFTIYSSSNTGEYFQNKILSGCPTGGSGEKYSLLASDTVSVVLRDYGSGVTITNDTGVLRFQIQISSGYTANNVAFYPMVRLATESDASFAPYSNICPISGRTAAVITRSDGDEISEDFTIQLGQTVYGGTLNVTTGVLTVTGGAVDLGDLTWSAVNGSRFLSVNEMPNVKIDTSVSAPRNAICSQYVWKKGGDLFNLDDAGFSYYIEGGENRLFVKDLRYSDAASFKAAMSGVTLVYELATPTTIQLTPTQLEMLKGYNRVTIESGTITLDYIPDNLAGDIISLVEEDYVKLEDVNTDPISVSGNPIVIQDAAAIKARSLITEINAIQDLHGLPFPYVGGAYKNKLPNLYTSKSSAGINYDVYDNGAVHAHGTSTNISAFSLGTFNLNDNSYIINGCPSGGGSSTYELQVVTSDNITYRDYGSGASFPANGTITGQILVRNGITIDKVFYPMIRLASESDPTFAPYSNICPISGRTAVVLTRSDGDEISEDFTIQLGQTVYGAEINWDTGVMTVKTAKKTYTAVNNKLNNAYRLSPNSTTDMLIENTDSQLPADTFISDKYKFYTIADIAYPTSTVIGGVAISKTSNGIYVTDPNMAGMTVEEASAYVALNPIDLGYPLATPTTIQLTPTQLEMLKGYNRITLTDGYGTIELSYQRDNISGDIASLVENELSVKADNSDISNNFELGSTASKAYSINQFMLREDGLYKVTANIASGAEITSSNTTKVTITEVLTALLNA